MRFDNYTSNTASDLAARVYVIDKTDRISHALDLMEKHNINQLLVTNEGEIVGVLTKKGIARTLGASGDIIKPASSLHVKCPSLSATRTPSATRNGTARTLVVQQSEDSTYAAHCRA